MYWWVTVYGRVDEHLLNCPMQWLDDQTICIAFSKISDEAMNNYDWTPTAALATRPTTTGTTNTTDPNRFADEVDQKVGIPIDLDGPQGGRHNGCLRELPG